MARQGGFLSGPTGVHNTQKIRKHVLKRGVTRDMNSAAGTVVNSKNPGSFEYARYSPGAKAGGPSISKTANPKRPSFRGGRTSVGRIMSKSRRRRR